MNECIETMMDEHQLIVRVLAALQTMAEKLEGGAGVARPDVAGFARFFREFADRCHHGKEEDRLFRAMIAAGFPRESGPIGVMLSEHDAGRQEVRCLAAIGAGTGPLTARETAELMASAASFVPLLYGHIQKENNILNPMAQQAIPAREFARLDESCATFDREVLGAAEVQGLKRLAEELIQRYPSDPAQLAIHAGCGGCASAAR